MLLLQDERVLSGTVSEASPTVGSSQARARAADVTAPPCGGGGGAGPGPGGVPAMTRAWTNGTAPGLPQLAQEERNPSRAFLLS